MIEAVLVGAEYAVAAALAAYLFDWAAFARMQNVIMISRAKIGQNPPDHPYRPTARWRVVCGALVAAFAFLAGATVHRWQTISIVLAITSAATMVLITFGDTPPTTGSQEHLS